MITSFQFLPASLCRLFLAFGNRSHLRKRGRAGRRNGDGPQIETEVGQDEQGGFLFCFISGFFFLFLKKN